MEDTQFLAAETPARMGTEKAKKGLHAFLPKLKNILTEFVVKNLEEKLFQLRYRIVCYP
jgi:hypothetical protein